MNTIPLERRIVTKLVENLVAAGYKPIEVWDGGEYQPATDVASVLAAVFSVDESTLYFDGGAGTHKRNGVFLVCGNGEDIISDFNCGDRVFVAAVDKTGNEVESLL